MIALLFVTPFLLLRVERSWPHFRAAVSGWLMDLSTAVQQPVAAWFRNRRYQWERWRITLRGAHEWQQLQQQAQHSTSLQIALTEQLLENQRLRRLLAARHLVQATDNAVLAQVISRKSAPVSNLLRIDRGHQHGLQVGDCVINADGVVGQVVLVAKTCSDVLLISAPSSVVDVIVQSTRARGMASGMGSSVSYRLLVEDFDRLHSVAAEDVVVTSGLDTHLGTRCPKGLPVGTVKTVTPMTDGVYVQALLEPLADLARLEEVLVLTTPSPQQQSNHD